MADLSMRETILEAYLELASQEGVGNLTLQKVAKHAKVAYGTVRYHFNEKDLSISSQAVIHASALARAFVEKYIAEAPEDDKLAVLIWVEANLKWAEKYPTHLSFFIYFYYLCSTRGPGLEINRGFLKIAVKRVSDLLYMDIGKGKIPKITNIPELSLAIHVHMVGTLFRAPADSEFQSWTKAQVVADRAMLALIKIYSEA